MAIEISPLEAEIEQRRRWKVLNDPFRYAQQVAHANPVKFVNAIDKALADHCYRSAVNCWKLRATLSRGHSVAGDLERMVWYHLLEGEMWKGRAAAEIGRTM